MIWSFSLSFLLLQCCFSHAHCRWSDLFLILNRTCNDIDLQHKTPHWFSPSDPILDIVGMLSPRSSDSIKYDNFLWTIVNKSLIAAAVEKLIIIKTIILIKDVIVHMLWKDKQCVLSFVLTCCGERMLQDIKYSTVYSKWESSVFSCEKNRWLSTTVPLSKLENKTHSSIRRKNTGF